MSIQADGYARVIDDHGPHYRAWFCFGDGEYRWSKRRFNDPGDAEAWGKRVVERWRKWHDTDICEQ